MSNSSNAPKLYDRPIAVAGATGKQGGAVAARLLARGHRVRALTRSPDKPAAAALAEAGAELVQADLEDRHSLDDALDGVAAVFSVQDFLEAGVDAEVRQGLNLTAAAAAANVDHIVYSGASTMDRHTGVPHLDSKWRIEREVRSLDVPWTVFRPAAFMENWAWERETILNEGMMPLSPGFGTRHRRHGRSGFRAAGNLGRSDRIAGRRRADAGTDCRDLLAGARPANSSSTSGLGYLPRYTG